MSLSTRMKVMGKMEKMDEVDSPDDSAGHVSRSFESASDTEIAQFDHVF